MFVEREGMRMREREMGKYIIGQVLTIQCVYDRSLASIVSPIAESLDVDISTEVVLLPLDLNLHRQRKSTTSKIQSVDLMVSMIRCRRNRNPILRDSGILTTAVVAVVGCCCYHCR